MNATTRTLAFLLGCMGLRLGFVVAAAAFLPGASNFCQWAAALGALAVSASWVYLYRYNARPNGIEAGGKIWWNHLRPFHASLYAAFAVLALTRPEYAYVPLLLDVILGFSAWANHRLFNK